MPSIEKVTIKRETWNTKKGKKFIVVARNKKGNVIARRNWNRKTNTTKKLQSTYKKSGSFSKDIKRTKFTNVNEVSDFSKRPRIPTGKMFSYVVEGTLRNGEILTARSMQHPKGFSISNAREEALTSFFERLHQKITGGYDADEGRALANKTLKSIREGVVYYNARKK